MQEVQDKQNILALGLVGYGKSTFLNIILGEDYFVSRFGQESVTKELSFKQKQGTNIVLYDVPGLGDPTISQKQWIKICEDLSNLELNTIFLVYNYQQFRVTQDELYSYSTIMKFLKGLKSKNVVAVYNKVPNFEESVKQNCQEHFKFLNNLKKYEMEPQDFILVNTDFEPNKDLDNLFIKQSEQTPHKVKNYKDENEINQLTSEIAKERIEDNQDLVESQCFFKDQIVFQKCKKNNKIEQKYIQDLKIGDYVLSYDKQQGFFYDKVVQIFEYQEKSYTTYRYDIIIQQQDKNINKVISLTQKHYVRYLDEQSNQFKLKTSSKVNKGDIIETIDNEISQNIIKGVVIDINIKLDKAQTVVHVRTRGWNIVVNNILATCRSIDDSKWLKLEKVELFFIDYLPYIHELFQKKYCKDHKNKDTLLGKAYNYFENNRMFQLN